MKKVIRARWLILSLWLIATITLMGIQPDINAILRHRGQQGLDADSPSIVADSMLSKMETSKGSPSIIVFFDKDKISDAEIEQINEAVDSIRDSGSKLGIEEIIDPFSMPEAKGSLLSKDGTTLMVSFKLDKGTREIDDIRAAIDDKLGNVDVEHYLTGESFIGNDYLKAALAGVEKSALLTVVFILIVLIAMFRAVVTPLVSLLAVAFSYLCSMGIAAQLIDKANFPVTSLTQVLLVLILFGIGTDYNILLFNRFREELSQGCSTDDAIVNTYKTAGKTIAYSIVTVLIAFFSLIFSESPIYKSGIVVVIGVVMLLLEILTLTPFFMKTLGNNLFWPSKNTMGHKESRLWYRIASASAKYPVISALIIVLVVTPTAYFHRQKLNFDNIAELGNTQPSTKGFNVVADHFGRGQAMPSTVVIKNAKALDNNESLSIIDNLTERIKKIDGVSQVSSVTQPQGKQIAEFYIGGQLSSVAGGLSKTQDGVDQMYDGLKLAQVKLSSSDFSKVSQMVDGTARLHGGMVALTNGLKRIHAGMTGSPEDSQSISSGIAAIENNLSQMGAGVKLLADNYGKMQSGYSAMGANYQNAAQALLGIKNTLSQVKALVANLGSSYSNSQRDPSYLGLQQIIDKLLESLTGITPEGMKALNDNYNRLTVGFDTANKNLSDVSGGLSLMAAGLRKLGSGIAKTADGIGTIVTNMESVSDGLGQMESGQRQLVSGLNGFGTFSGKLSDMNNGLKQISEGLGKTNEFLSQLDTNKTFHIPKEALANQGFKKSLDAFMSSDRTLTKMIVVLNDDPYSKEALSAVREINEALSNGLKGTALSGATFGVSGPSAMTGDMNDILNRDLNKMIVVVLIGVFLVLLLVIRSFWMPVFITASLIGSYYAVMFVLNYIFINLMGLDGVSSYVPFFSFIVIVALGVDYSIFLMMRYKEYPHLSPKEAIVMASRHIGSVVTSAAVILGGTFATLIPSGLTLLSQLAIGVIAGLIVLCFIMLPIFLPAMIALSSAITDLPLKRRLQLQKPD